MNEESQLVPVEKGVEMVGMRRAELDSAIATAKAYPRDIKKCKSDAIALATMDEETAGECFYAIPRAGKTIEGPSIRCAEIVASCWGNLKYGSQVLGHDGKHVTGLGICIDLEKNVTCTIETKRKITDRNGNTFNEDMITVTGNAAAAIARRQAVFGAIPKTIVKAVYQQAKKLAIGDATSIRDRWAKAITAFSKMNISEKEIFEKLEKTAVEEITLDDIALLLGLHNALRDGEITIDEAFKKTIDQTPQRKSDTKPTGKKRGRPPKAKPETTQQETPQSPPEPEPANEPQTEPVSTSVGDEAAKLIRSLSEFQKHRKNTFQDICGDLGVNAEEGLSSLPLETLRKVYEYTLTV